MRIMGISGKFVALEGMDGVGKTTLTRRVVDQLCDSRLHIQVDAFSPKSTETSNEYGRVALERISSLLWPSVEAKKKASDFPVDYWFHLQAAWYAAMSDLVLDETLANGRMQISDGWYYKFAAKLCVQGHSPEDVMKAFSGCREPDLVILLNMRPADVWARKKQFSAYEIHGLTSDTSQDERKSFIAFQGAIQEMLEVWARSSKWAILDVSPEHTEDMVAKMIVEVLQRRGLIG